MFQTPQTVKKSRKKSTKDQTPRSVSGGSRRELKQLIPVTGNTDQKGQLLSQTIFFQTGIIC